jgi:multidrug efflux pump subunit AcrA (membrane-fusion protein)
MAQTRSLKKNSFGTFKTSSKKWYKTVTNFIKRKPLGSFFIALGLLFVIIIIGHILGQPKAVVAQKPPPKQVTLYSIGTAPKATFQAKIQKAGVITINSQTGGIVQSISVQEGSSVSKGDQLLALSSNYQGGNALGVSAQIAQAQYQNLQDTYSEQQDAINQQQSIANQTFDNYNSQQAIASQSANNTNALISSNQSVLNTLNQQLTTDQNNGAPSPTTMPEETQINTLQGAQNQLEASLANLQQQQNSNLPPGQLAVSQRNLTLDQLDIQQKALSLNKEITGMQAQLAEINADTMLPASPVDGVVDRVFVRVGQQVSQGTELAIISAKEGSAQTIAVVDVPQEIAQTISRIETSDLYLNGKSYSMKPFYISTDATDGLLYSVFYTIPTKLANLVTDGEYISINIPIGSVNSDSTVPFVPIDAVYQTQDSNYILLDVNGKAVSRKVSLGNVFGSFVEVTNGLESGDQVILDRNVIEGDSVTTN